MSDEGSWAGSFRGQWIAICCRGGWARHLSRRPPPSVRDLCARRPRPDGRLRANRSSAALRHGFGLLNRGHRYTQAMNEFADVARARAAYRTFTEAVEAGREIVRRAGVPDPPPVPDFDAVFRRLPPPVKEELYAELRKAESLGPADAIRLWQPFIRKAFGQPKA